MTPTQKLQPVTIDAEGGSSDTPSFYESQRRQGLSIDFAGPDRKRINPAVAYLTTLQSPASIKTMSSVLNRTAAILGFSGYETAPWEHLRREHVQALMAKLVDNNLAPSTRNMYLAAIKGVVRESWLAGGLDSNEYQRIAAVKSAKGSRINTKGRVIGKDETKKLLGREPSEDSNLRVIRDKAIIALMLTCGLRKSELCTLKTENVNKVESFFTVIGKGDKEAKVFITAAAAPYLDAWISAKDKLTEYLFTPINRHNQVIDKRITGQGITFILKRSAEESIVKPFAPHDTRRTFATRMIESGADLMKVRDAMRHSSIETTQRYNIQNEEQLRAAIEAVDVI